MGCLEQRSHDRTAGSQDDIRCKRDQFRSVLASVDEVSCVPADVDAHVLAVDPAQLPQPLQECRLARLSYRIVLTWGPKHADAPHTVARLRAPPERPRKRQAADKADELPSPHGLPCPMFTTERKQFFDTGPSDQMVAVGTRIAPRPPPRSRRALLTHRAPPSGFGVKAAAGQRV